MTPVSNKGIGSFSSSGKFNVYGNIMSIYYGDDFIGQTDLTGKNYAFYKLFYQCSKLINAENIILQAKILYDYCYSFMFSGCLSLTKAPELPATTLASYCYFQMFGSCYSLTTAPELQASTLKTGCYNYMFNLCSSLTKAPDLPATTLAGYCYTYMFSSCSSLTTTPELKATTLTPSCYRGMFSGCTSLTEAPDLPATKLASYCYNGMFSGCTSLTEAPDLPATTLADSCYYRMFFRCQNLRYVKCLATDISATDCLTDWLDGTMLLGTFITAENKPAYESGTSGIPLGWTSYTESQYEEVRHYELENKVSSSTSGLNIEVVNALPETPAENTIYVII